MKENRLVVADSGWAETIPEWLKKEVMAERIICGIATNTEKIEYVGDAEACLYLYTASLRAPMSHEMNEIYVYLTAKLMKRQGMEVFPFMQEKLEKGLSTYEGRELADLKSRLYRARGGEIHNPILDALRALKPRQKEALDKTIKEAMI